MILRASFSHTDPSKLALRLQDAGFRGTVSRSWDAGDCGVEAGATIEVACLRAVEVARFKAFIVEVLEAWVEQTATVTVNGRRAYLLWQDGHAERIG